MMAAMRSEAIPGPGTALEDLHRDHYRSLVRLASLLVDDLATCEEIVQDAFVAVFRKPGLVRDEAKLPAYLRSAVLNGARSYLRGREVRNRARPLRVVRDAESPEAGAVLADDQRAVLDALRALPDRQRDVLVLRFYLDLSEAQIAETLGIKAGTVKTHVRRGLEALATTLEDRR
jgi:RNA polymerase sigma-70 factor (sigma-E family)